MLWWKLKLVARFAVYDSVREYILKEFDKYLTKNIIQKIKSSIAEQWTRVQESTPS